MNALGMTAAALELFTLQDSVDDVQYAAKPGTDEDMVMSRALGLAFGGT